MKENLSVDYLKERINYNQDVGSFTWSENSDVRFALKTAGYVNDKGYLVVSVHGTRYYAHRLAWAITHGYFPKFMIDHIDGNKLNNKISNLREVTASQNQWNQIKPNSRSKTGYLGVSIDLASQKYVASIRKNKKKIHIGRFECAIDAHNAYLKMKREIHDTCTI